ncbi:hypothetical protein OG393_00480 [Streptomyces sp. NBC_01216]|nr:hypothetical protein OG393_00480 [Streptomyces sp. NBC_01216]
MTDVIVSAEAVKEAQLAGLAPDVLTRTPPRGGSARHVAFEGASRR